MSFQTLHEKLHTLREGIGGVDWKTPEFLNRLCQDVLNMSNTYAKEDTTDLKKLKKQLETLTETENTYDVHKRLEIDELACNILNNQEKRIKGGKK
jgi:hypothetical protein